MNSKNLAVFDIDKTLTRELLAVPMLKSEEESQLLAPGTVGTAAELLTALKNGELAYEDAAHRLIVAHANGLRGMEVAALHEHAGLFLAQHTELFRRFGKEVMNLLRPSHQLIAITAEPEYIASAVAEWLAMDKALASKYEVKDGKFTGNVSRSLAHRSEKRKLLGEVRPDFAFGDSAGDIEMLSRAHHAFCIAPDAELKRAAQENGWGKFTGEDDTDEIIRLTKEQLKT